MLLIGVCLSFLALYPWRFDGMRTLPGAVHRSRQWLRSVKDPIRLWCFIIQEEKATPPHHGLLEDREANRNIQVEVVDYLKKQQGATNSDHQIQEPLEENACLCLAIISWSPSRS